MAHDNNIPTDEEEVAGKATITHVEAEQQAALSEEEKIIEKQLRRKIDLLIMPVVIIVYLMNYIDRNNYAAARLQGLEKDLHLSSEQYQVALSMFFVAYILMQVPSNLLLNYAGRPAFYLGFFITAWGLVSALTSLVTNYRQIVALRFLLGFVEAPFFAGVLFYLSKWYTKEELAVRMSIFYSGSLLSGAFGNLIAAGILKGLAGKRGLGAWQWLYIIEGTITICIGILVCFILPDFPDTWRLLSPEMKQVANRRLALEAAEADMDAAGRMSQLHGLKLALKDPKTYILTVAYWSIAGAGGFQYFFPTLTATLGYSHYISLVLIAPPYLFMVFWSIIHSRISDTLAHRFWFFVYPIPLTIAGFIIFMTTDSFGPRYFSFFLMIFIFAMNGILYSWIANAIPRPPAKRAAALAIINCVANSASIWTPYTYRPQDAPHYRPALGICIGFQAVAALMAVLLRWHLQKENQRLARLDSDDVVLTQSEVLRLEKTAEIEGIDISAARRLQLGFRYII
ncbi:probable permease of the major facilitator superfamily [Phialocephala subalpina]|uniref:Probable permease of the major facilitator superfamily n=1 Tax=Phialocephala subalpina TaxID=576137 RepID=A0A1L7XXT2_9HELO|nr:probable permease of the major facilitator superfamily [Phialocephala subalpina]